MDGRQHQCFGSALNLNVRIHMLLVYGVYVEHPDGSLGFRGAIASADAYFAYLRRPFSIESSISVGQHLADQPNVLCVPGSLFGPGQERYLPIALANPDTSQNPPLTQRLGASSA